jgi:anthranilate synthase/aminodeoxychorismate synthase-like glutamine amidotransferase
VTLLIDNYDSFTFNIYQYIEEMGEQCIVKRNNEITVEEALALNPDRVVISPGPGAPHEAGISMEIIRAFAGRRPVLGVCLGHQAIGEVFGGKVIRAPRPKHGKLSRVSHDGLGLFRNMQSPFSATRYHSLAIERESLPSCLEITAESEDGVIMGVRHRDFQVEGVQFHPESIATVGGREILRNFLKVS